jgi:hypothetical protein
MRDERQGVGDGVDAITLSEKVKSVLNEEGGA